MDNKDHPVSLSPSLKSRALVQYIQTANYGQTHFLLHKKKMTLPTLLMFSIIRDLLQGSKRDNLYIIELILTKHQETLLLTKDSETTQGIIQDTLLAAISFCYLNLVEFCLNNGAIITEKVINEAVEHSDRSVMKVLLRQEQGKLFVIDNSLIKILEVYQGIKDVTSYHPINIIGQLAEVINAMSLEHYNISYSTQPFSNIRQSIYETKERHIFLLPPPTAMESFITNELIEQSICVKIIETLYLSLLLRNCFDFSIRISLTYIKEAASLLAKVPRSEWVQIQYIKASNLDTDSLLALTTITCSSLLDRVPRINFIKDDSALPNKTKIAVHKLWLYPVNKINNGPQKNSTPSINILALPLEIQCLIVSFADYKTTVFVLPFVCHAFLNIFRLEFKIPENMYSDIDLLCLLAGEARRENIGVNSLSLKS